MGAPEVLYELVGAGMHVSVHGERLRVSPASALTDGLRERLRASKAELLALMRRGAAGDAAADSWRPTLPGDIQPATAAKFRAASLALDAKLAALHSDAIPYPDRWCWPASDAMTGAEIERFMNYVMLLGCRGLGLANAQALADRLVLRDRDSGDDRHSCTECRQGERRRCADGTPLPSD